ncbi:VanW family protein [Paenibacillus sp. N1-5-1-14]|uniref:VanW family protein n=1 Tax=Paenibacillus radicibacter TaxID=2972488 RepID=UPI0021598717|nr:VanW family protein [Paenibacillus radicibacter]MCR8645006.1 VanW family protein [Paenibacillus radicibacter]
MKWNRRLIILVTSIVSTITLVGSFIGYAKQQSMPSEFRVEGIEAGGQSLTQFRKVWQEQVRLLKSQPVVLQATSKGLAPRRFTLEQLGLRVDYTAVQATLNRLFTGSLLNRAQSRWTFDDQSIQVPLTFDENILTTQVTQSWPGLYRELPLSAKRTVTETDEIHYIPEKTALRIESKKLKDLLIKSLPTIGYIVQNAKPITLEIPTYAMPPEITLESLKTQGITRKIVEFSTPIVDPSPGRLHNVEATAAVIQDMLLKPGEVFDYEKVIEATAKRYGFQEAKVILNGKLVPGVGGGICQVSTTLYNAVLRSGLAIVERRNHSLPISYAPLGQDATFSTGYINFRFRNNTDGYLLIRTETSNERFTVKLFGTLKEDTTYQIESKVVEQIPPEVKYVANPDLAPNQEVQVLAGKPGYIVETYRTMRKNGQFVSREKISRDTYYAQPTVIAVQKLTSPPEKKSEEKPKIEDGVSGPIYTDKEGI